MTTLRPRVRFAPSPTGELHIGNARTALINWLFARHHGGDFALRIEDTDRQRTSPVYERNIIEDLKWLSLDWNEGPDIGGPFGPYHQSERIGVYEGYLRVLQDAGLVYPCWCTTEELEAERAAMISGKMPPRYGGKCRRLTDSERMEKERRCGRPAYRFQVEGRIEFQDVIRGTMKFDETAFGDFIIMRSDGSPAYNFAVVVDDHLMRITHVIRGEDHLSNTASQILLYRALGFSPPVFAHHALITGKDHAKLSKRHGSVSVREFRERGFLPEAVINYLALLGSSFGEGQEIISRERMIREFSLEKTGKSAAVFDEDKLRWMNGVYLRNYGIDELLKVLEPFIRKAGYEYDSLDRTWLYAVVDAVRDNLTLLTDIGEYLDLFHKDRFTTSPAAAAVIAEGRGRELLLMVIEALESEKQPDGELFARIAGIAKKRGIRGRELYMPLRAALTGSTHGPELDRIFSILGREEILTRLARAIRY